jgi:hypothetical protein
LIATTNSNNLNNHHVQDPERNCEVSKSDLESSPAQKFAKRVQYRAKDDRGGRQRLSIGLGIFVQLLWLAILFFACFFLESRSVLAYWCKVCDSYSPTLIFCCFIR